MSRLAARFAALKKEGRAAFIPFVSAGDPDLDTSFAILSALPGAGADIIELGMPFSDPMADGPAVQASSMRALKAGGYTGQILFDPGAASEETMSADNRSATANARLVSPFILNGPPPAVTTPPVWTGSPAPENKNPAEAG